MSSLFVSLLSSTSALRAFERSLATVQNNVTNASTPGYVRQRQVLDAASFQPERGIAGGVTIGERQSARDLYTEQLVRRQQSGFGEFQQLKASLSELEPVFDVTGEAGIPGALSELFQSFSVLSVSPNDAVARQNVIEQAGQVGNAFRQTALTLEDAAGSAGRGVEAAVENINRLTGLLRDLNARIQVDARNANDPSIDAQVHATLETLSEVVDVQIIRQDNGTFNVLMAGQTPLLVGDRQYQITADTKSSVTARVLDASGADVTSQIRTGRLGAQFDLNNNKIPGWLQSLDHLAETLAANVNMQLRAGLDSQGQAGADLFTFQAADPARTLAAAAIAPAQIAAASAGAAGGNGNALVLAAFDRSPQVGDFTFTGYYAEIAAQFGRDLAGAKANQSTAQQLLVQARAMRQEESGVSLDEEAARLIEFQRSYQAAMKLITVLDDLTLTMINMIR